MLDYIFNLVNWNLVYFNNRIIDYVNAVLVFFILFLIIFLLKLLIIRIFSKTIKETKNKVDDFLLNLVKSVHGLFLFFTSLYIAFLNIVVTHVVSRVIAGLAIIVFTWQFLRIFHVFIKYITNLKLGNFLNKKNIEAASGIFSVLFNFGVWTLAIMYILSSNGVNIASLIAGIGVGGMVVAFALKDVLEDLFSSFSIYLDKPFSIGDSVKIDDTSGTIRRIGFKSTRIKALNTGEEVILSNKGLSTKKIINFSRIQKRRVSMQIKISRYNSLEKINKVPDIIEDIISNIELVDYKRTHLRNIEDGAFVYTIVYVIDKNDYSLYLNIHQKILLDILSKFKEQEIELNYPNSTILMKNKF